MSDNRKKHDVNNSGEYVGNDDIGGDQLHTEVGGGASGSVVGSKNVRQSRSDSPDVTVNNYERGANDAVLRLEEKLEAQIDRLSDNVSARITQFESNMNWKLELVDRDIDELKHNAGRLWLPVLSIIASLIIAAALFYFGGGMYSLSIELKQQRIGVQKSGVFYAKPSGFMGVGKW